MKNAIGIMQGRLSHPSKNGPQVFPTASWREEFPLARDLGFNQIEWLIEAESLLANPLMSDTGRTELKKIEAASGIQVCSACIHCVLQWKPFAPGGAERIKPLPAIIAAAAQAGLERLIIPILEEATIIHASTPAQAAEIFSPALQAAEHAGMDLAFEMDRPEPECREFIKLLRSPRARLCYDCGNATALGYDIVGEISSMLPLVGEIHLKDRRVRGPSKPLGEGETRLAEFFSTLKAQAWGGPFILETPVLSDPTGQARKNLLLVKEFWS